MFAMQVESAEDVRVFSRGFCAQPDGFDRDNWDDQTTVSTKWGMPSSCVAWKVAEV
jgi:hypothetical protein